MFTLLPRAHIPPESQMRICQELADIFWPQSPRTVDTVVASSVYSSPEPVPEQFEAPEPDEIVESYRTSRSWERSYKD